MRVLNVAINGDRSISYPRQWNNIIWYLGLGIGLIAATWCVVRGCYSQGQEKYRSKDQTGITRDLEEGVTRDITCGTLTQEEHSLHPWSSIDGSWGKLGMRLRAWSFQLRKGVIHVTMMVGQWQAFRIYLGTQCLSNAIVTLPGTRAT